MNGEYFLLRVDIGLGVSLIKRTSRRIKGRFGVLAYGFHGLPALLSARTMRYHLTIDGRPVESDGVACLVANMGSVSNIGSVARRFGRSFTTDIAPDDGLLDVFVVQKNWAMVLSFLTTVLLGRELETATRHWQAREVTVTVDPAQDIVVDGDLHGQTPLAITVMSQAIRIVVPGTE